MGRMERRVPSDTSRLLPAAIAANMRVDALVWHWSLHCLLGGWMEGILLRWRIFHQRNSSPHHLPRSPVLFPSIARHVYCAALRRDQHGCMRLPGSDWGRLLGSRQYVDGRDYGIARACLHRVSSLWCRSRRTRHVNVGSTHGRMSMGTRALWSFRRQTRAVCFWRKRGKNDLYNSLRARRIRMTYENDLCDRLRQWVAARDPCASPHATVSYFVPDLYRMYLHTFGISFVGHSRASFCSSSQHCRPCRRIPPLLFPPLPAQAESPS